jgi:branched-chain amino acid transport system ATP-binding protein
MVEPVLKTTNLRKEFDGLVAVDDVSVSFAPDELYAIIGPNGAGKTTFFDLITGVLQPTRGSIYFQDEDITDLSVRDVARRKLVRSYQITQVFDELSVIENVRIAVQSNYQPYNFWQDVSDIPELTDQAMDILEEVGLADKRDIPAENLSHGEQRTLEIAIALGSDPEMLLLDEPSSGMSPEETTEVISLVDELATRLPIILIEHKMSVVRQVADEILVLHNGQVLAFGPPEEIQQDERVREVYLGGQTL